MQDQKARARRRQGKSAGGRPRKLSHEAILQGAEELILREGTGALTLRSLGAQLGVQAPTLYTYFSNLEEIEEAALARIFGTVPVPDLQRPEPLAEQLLEMFLALRQLQIRSPGSLANTVGSAAWHWEIRLVNQLLKIFSEIGVENFRTVVAFRALLGLTASAARAERADDRAAEEALLPTLPESEVGYILRLFNSVPGWFGQSAEERYRLTLVALIEILLPQVLKHDAERKRRG